MLYNLSYKNPVLKFFIIFSLIFVFSSVNGQFIENFLGFSGKKKASKSGKTELTADTLDFDIPHNLIIFKGNVLFNNDDVTIKCDKMMIHLKNSKEKSQEGKALKKIICTGNVEFIRKTSPEEQKKNGIQKAIAGRADYIAEDGTITLTQNPILMQGKNKLRGQKQIIFREIWLFRKAGHSSKNSHPNTRKSKSSKLKRRSFFKINK